MAGPAELRIKLDRPAYVYPMFEQALRIASGESAGGHLRRIGELWSQFSGVAAKNPHAWSREPLAPHQIWQPGPRNRMISWPYTKLMNSNNMVDQGAALVLTSVENATYLRFLRSVGFSRTPAPIRTTRTRSASARSSTGRLGSGSPASGHCNWPASASTIST